MSDTFKCNHCFQRRHNESPTQVRYAKTVEPYIEYSAQICSSCFRHLQSRGDLVYFHYYKESPPALATLPPVLEEAESDDLPPLLSSERYFLNPAAQAYKWLHEYNKMLNSY